MGNPIRDNYVQYRTDPEHDEYSLAHFCTKYGYSLSEVKKALLDDKTLEKDILESRRLKYASRMQKIDDALFKSAAGGDTRAADLLYRRFDGWSPKLAEMQTNNFYNFADIAKEAAKPKRSQIFKRIRDDDGSTEESE